MGACHKHNVYWNDRKAITGECYKCVIEERDELKKDRDRLDFLQALNDKASYSGRCVLRWSTSGRGWRLHESNGFGIFTSVRQAIDDFMGVDHFAGGPDEVEDDPSDHNTIPI